MRLMYHISINSFYLEIVRIKYNGEDYIKAHVRYWSKGSMVPFSEERNLKIRKDVMKHWEKAYV